MVNKLFLLCKKGFLLLIVFFYVYPVLFVFVPFGLRTRTLYAILGSFLIFLRKYRSLKKGECQIDRGIWRLIMVSLIISLITLCSLVINGTTEVLFLYMPFSLLVVILAAYFVTNCFKVLFGRISFELLAQYLVGAVVLQMLFSIMFFLYPELMIACNNMLSFGELERKVVEGTVGLRIQGFGTNFFEAGVTNSCALLLVFIILKYTRRHSFYYIIALLFITVVGSMMSRTTLVGCGLGLIIWLYNSSILRLRIPCFFFRVCKYILFVFCVLSVCLLFLPAEQLSKFDVVAKFGFEIFVNYADSGKLETASSNELKEVFIFPSELKTIIIGDGLLSDPINPNLAYYMNTDVGYSRLIYYFGVLGTLAFFCFYCYLCYRTALRNKEKYDAFFIMLFILMLILHLKGCSNIIFFIMFFFFLNNRKTTSVTVC